MEFGSKGRIEDDSEIPDVSTWVDDGAIRHGRCFGLCVCGQGVAKSLVLHRSRLSCQGDRHPRVSQAAGESAWGEHRARRS